MTRECISIVLPVYHEHENIAKCLRGLWAALKEHEHEILVCYDSTEDPTLAAIEAMPDSPPSIRLVENELGSGAAGAILSGFSAARGDVVVTSMADLSDPPQLIPAMAAKVRAEGADVVSGSRYMRGGSQSGGPLLKRTMSRAAGLSLRWLTGMGTHDPTSNFRGYSSEFLREVEVETREGFDIALELTVKAHLSGRKVSEVPSSWVDRSAGSSRFKLWKWLPRYLRWYADAAIGPLFVWATFFGLTLLGLNVASEGGHRKAIDFAMVLALSAGACSSILLARHLRGRMILSDVVLPCLWLIPWALGPLNPWYLAGAVGGSGLLMGLTSGWRSLGRWLQKCAYGLSSRMTQANIGLALLGFVIWLRQWSWARPTSGPNLDESWTQAVGYALKNGFQWGQDIVFTFGPLAYFQYAPYDSDLYWMKIVWWEAGFKILTTVFLLLGSRYIFGALNKTLYFLGLIVLPLAHDAYSFITILAITAILLDHRDRAGDHSERSGRSRVLICLGLFVLSALTILKFTYFVLCVASVGGVVLFHLWRRCVPDALRTAGLYLFLIAGLWTLCGQSLLNFPRYVILSMEIASGYNEAMSLYGDVREANIAFAVLGLAYGLVLLRLLARPTDPARSVMALVTAAAFFIAFKAGYVRHSTELANLFPFAAIAILMLTAETPGTGWTQRILNVSQTPARIACVGLSWYAFALPMHHGLNVPHHLLTRFTQELHANIRGMADFPSQQAHLEAYRHQQRRYWHLPKVCAHVGDRTIDLFSHSQGVLLLNDLNWCPRPAFQGYVAYTPGLLALNGRFLESEDAPDFVLHAIEGLDRRLPLMNDTEAVQVLLRDYEVVLYEKGYLLFERRPGAPLAPAKNRSVALEQTITWNERYEIGRLEGGCYLLSLDIRYTPLGRLAKIFAKTPPVRMFLINTWGGQVVFRVVPGMMKSGVILKPLIYQPMEWAKWFTGDTAEEAVSIKLTLPHGGESLFEPEIGMKLVRADDLVPRQGGAELRSKLLYTAFDPPPTEITSLNNHGPQFLEDNEVYSIQSASKVRFDLEAGVYQLQVGYGIEPAGYSYGNRTDGVTFRIVTESEEGARMIFQRHLNPLVVEEDRGTSRLTTSLSVSSPFQLYLVTDPGPAKNRVADFSYWSGVSVTKVEPAVGDG